MESIDFELSRADLIKLFGNSKKRMNLSPLYNGQKAYVSKLRIILHGFSNYLISKKKVPKIEGENILDDVVLFLQHYHLGYSEEALDEIDHTEYEAFFEYFVVKKWLGVTPEQVKSFCHSLKIFIEFLREKMSFYQKEPIFKKILDSLNSKRYKDLLNR